MMHDVLVIGAGPAGSTAALALARSGWNVAIVERVPFPRPKVCGEHVSAAGWPLLGALGVADDLLADAGPPVDTVGFFAGEAIVTRAMPRPPDGGRGRALGRETLDTRLLAAARRAGARVLQPCTVTTVERLGQGFRVHAGERGRPPRPIEARIVIAAHGSWETGPLATQPPRRPPAASDLLGFKARFLDARLARGLMPLVLFPGGYGGLVHADRGRVGFSCCIRREALESARSRRPGLRAGEAVMAHALESCRGLREALAGALRDGPWLSAGPIRPGTRPLRRDGIFVVGNAAGEAHPLVAEGIGMAIQSAFLLCEALGASGEGAFDPAMQRDIEREYAHAWREHLAARVRAAEWFARLTMNRATLPAIAAALGAFPAMLSMAARWSGKSRPPARIAP